MIDTTNVLLEALQKTGGAVEVTESLYSHFFEVLPPRDMGLNFFIFQEGAGEKLYFRRWGDHYFCYLLSDYLVTDDWKLHVGVSRNVKNAPFKLLYVYSDEGTCEVPNEFDEFIGKEFVSVSAVADAMNVNFRV